MSIIVNNLTKIYGEQKAVNNVSFTVNKGEIVGLLGKNGAGKSTTMKIATCFIPPSSGTVELCGFDVVKNPIDVKKKVGYLPEHNPLYLDMYVHEFLSFIGDVHQMKGIQLKNRIAEVIEMVGLPLEQNKKIGALSKGYRQRVGLAQAIIHDPEVLILDEPSTGLDPTQIIEIRELIRSLGQNKTVIFSSHNLAEVKALCHRVVMLNRGEKIVDDSLNNLLSTMSGGVAIVAQFDKELQVDQFKSLSFIKDIKNEGLNRYTFIVPNDKDYRVEISKKAAEINAIILELKQSEQSLEEVFINYAQNSQN